MYVTQGQRTSACEFEFQIQSDDFLLRKIHVIVVPDIRSQIVDVKDVAIGEVGSAVVVTLVFIYLARTLEQSSVIDSERT
jgi:hypothetical protein